MRCILCHRELTAYPLPTWLTITQVTMIEESPECSDFGLECVRGEVKAYDEED